MEKKQKNPLNSDLSASHNIAKKLDPKFFHSIFVVTLL